MKVKVLVSMAGPDFVVSEGDVVDWPAGRAKHFLKAGYVELIEKPKPKRKPRKK
jgi:hypothetical protein